jgi:heme oxygenase (mycobilin-producing)
MTPRVRVLVWHRVPPDATETVADAYRTISQQLAGTPGLIGNELLRSPQQPDSMVVGSEWESLADFLAWERTDSHRSTTAPLRPYRDPYREPPYEVLEVVSAFPEPESGAPGPEQANGSIPRR